MKKQIILTFIVLCCSHLINAQNNYADSLRQRLTSAKDDAERVDLLSDLARSYMFFYPDTAENYGEQGLQLARKINYKPGEAGCMLSLCITLTFSGKYISALDYGLKATPLITELRDTTMLIWNNIQIMSCYRQLEDYDQALNYGYVVLKLFKNFHAAANQVSVGLGALGAVYEKKNQLDSALYYEQRAFRLDTSWCQLFQYIGQTYDKSGHIDIALDYYKRGLNNAVKENNVVGFIDLCNNISKVFELSGQIDSSIWYANKAITISGRKINPEGLLETSTQLARLYEMQGNSDSAVKYLKAANTFKDSLYNRKKPGKLKVFPLKKSYINRISLPNFKGMVTR